MGYSAVHVATRLCRYPSPHAADGDSAERSGGGTGPLVKGYDGFIWPQYWYLRNVIINISRSNVPELVAVLRSYLRLFFGLEY
jgi:hypothetical protein